MAQPSGNPAASISSCRPFQLAGNSARLTLTPVFPGFLSGPAAKFPSGRGRRRRLPPRCAGGWRGGQSLQGRCSRKTQNSQSPRSLPANRRAACFHRRQTLAAPPAGSPPGRRAPGNPAASRGRKGGSFRGARFGQGPPPIFCPAGTGPEAPPGQPAARRKSSRARGGPCCRAGQSPQANCIRQRRPRRLPGCLRGESPSAHCFPPRLPAQGGGSDARPERAGQ